jgi:hypothetical protein
MKEALKRLEGLAGTYATLYGDAAVTKIESQDLEGCLERLRIWQAGVVKVCEAVKDLEESFIRMMLHDLS